MPRASAGNFIESRYGTRDSDFDDSDSGYDEMSLSTASLRSSIFEYDQENGRSYHAFRRGRYVIPNDEGELERQEIHYHAVKLLLHQHHFWAPVQQPTAILDVGTGSGAWAVDVADEFENATVLGIDLSPTFPTAVPENLLFEVMDADDPWTFSQRFDLVHTRLMNGFSVRSWPDFYTQAFKCMKPGGWVENQEFDLGFFSDDDSIPADCALQRWSTMWEDGVRKMGLTGRCNPDAMKLAMEAAGFINVTVHRLKLPYGPWPRDQRLREVGLLMLIGVLDGLEGLSLRVFTQMLGWTVEELNDLLADVRKDMKNKKIHTYNPFYVIYGQKPLPS